MHLGDLTEEQNRDTRLAEPSLKQIYWRNPKATTPIFQAVASRFADMSECSQI